ncbi:MAG: hypothetical protein PF569_03185 [Candidatus Woesearchaeota archaeon]|jgi:hypothetical protein|nr:hypothetical protein [Candidatus Woesearchaeota archaeon]
MDSYLNTNKATQRLINEYLKYNTLIIGFDFDATIFDRNNEGLDVKPVINQLRRASDAGMIMCLHTLCIKYKDVKQKIEYVRSLGINVHHVNSSPVLNNSYPLDAKKPFYSILLDDRAGLASAFLTLLQTLNKLKL